jgi:adenylate cyclase
MTSKPENKMEPQTLPPRRSAATQAAQARARRGSAKGLLPIYLGKQTSERVLAGHAKRGTGEKIHAVIWLCDLRDSTLFSETMSIENFFALLSDFFDCTAGAVLAHGGEILSYIGDAVFAIFPISGSDKPLQAACIPEEGACAAALAAARDARTRMEALNRTRRHRGEPTLEFGLALHVGDVMYGNIGVSERLQFTVIGAAANEASRLAGLCKTLGEPILISSAFPLCFPGEMISLGFHHLRGVEHPQEIFTLSDGRLTQPRAAHNEGCRRKSNDLGKGARPTCLCLPQHRRSTDMNG